tara:strand:+ start:160 stop:1041 length:882 start_codon:yes stop_codon:yes gene_type:complete
MNKLKTAVLLIVFNRPDTTPLVFEKIRQAKPPRLYIAGDGPRDDNDGDKEKIAKVREISTNVDWPCEVKTLFSDKNLGCKEGVSSAITWFFENEEQGIILEDDCVPHLDFFTFCENLLDYYSNDERVSVITGNNFQNGKLRGDASYYFSKFNHVWGWASWRRSWKHYQDDISFWPDWQKSSHWLKYIPNKVERTYWEKIFNKIYLNPKYVWDYYWAASVWYKNGLTITPNVNLVSNIGFGDHATHTKDKNSKFSNMSVNSLGNLTHPKKVERNYLADSLTFEYLKLLNIFTER